MAEDPPVVVLDEVEVEGEVEAGATLMGGIVRELTWKPSESQPWAISVIGGIADMHGGEFHQSQFVEK